jgi:hypothetical protein
MRTNLAIAALALAAATSLAACGKTPGMRPVDLRADVADCGVHSVAQGEHLPAGAAECIVTAVADGTARR